MSRYTIVCRYYLWLYLLGILVVVLPLQAQQDYFHDSRVFGREKPFRVFLPNDYDSSQKKYPVIYYFHGNKGTHELNISGVADLVAKNDVILVAWNGRSMDNDIRPYNIGNHSNIRSKIY